MDTEPQTEAHVTTVLPRSETVLKYDRFNGTKYTVYEIYETKITVDEEHISLEGEPILIEIPKGQGTREALRALEQLEHHLSLLDGRYQGPKGLRKSESIAYTVFQIYPNKEEIEIKETKPRRFFPPSKRYPVFVKVPKSSDASQLSEALKRFRTELAN